MERSARPTENRKPAGVMRCKECGGDVFSRHKAVNCDSAQLFPAVRAFLDEQ